MPGIGLGGGLTFQDVGACNCPAGSCSVLFTVRGCGGNAYASVPTVNVFASSGGALLASGTVNASGVVTLTFTGGSGTYWVTITGASTRFATFAQNEALTCGGSLTIALSAASGYVCIGCLLPVATTLHLTDSTILGGPVTCVLTYSTPNWVGTTSVAYPGTFCTGVPCSAATVPLTYTLFGSGDIRVSYPINIGGSCPVATGAIGSSGNSGNSIVSCPPTFLARNMGLSGTDIPGQALYGCPGSAIASISITE